MTDSEQSLSALQQFAAERGISARPGVPLAGYTTFRIGGPAGLLCEPEDEASLLALVGGGTPAGCAILSAGQRFQRAVCRRGLRRRG